MKKKFKKILSLILAVAMVFTSFVLLADTIQAEQTEGMVRLYCYIGGQEGKTDAADWGFDLEEGSNASVAEKGETDVEINEWNRSIPSLIADKENEGWAYIGLSCADIMGYQFVYTDGTVLSGNWSTGIQTSDLSAAYLKDGKWYTEISCENPISENAEDNGVNEPERTKLKLYYYITDDISDQDFADYGVSVCPETTTFSEAGPKFTVTGESDQKYVSLLDADLVNTVDGLPGKWGYVGLDSTNVEELRFVEASYFSDVNIWNSVITNQGLTEAYYIKGYGWFKDSAANEAISTRELQNKFYIVGSHNEWNLHTADEMVVTEDGYELTLNFKAGSYEFTPVQDKDNFAWEYQYKDKDNNWNNYAFTLEDDRAVTFVVKNADPAQGTADVAVYKNYTVIFKDGDCVLDTNTLLEGVAATAPEAPTKTGYIFDGWDKAFDNITSDLTINAKWVKKTYTVTFKDGDSVLKVQTVKYDEAAMPPEEPEKKGYTFDGWDVEFNNITSNLTVNAKWVKKATYTVTFMDGGTVLGTQVIEEGAAATAPASPTKTGYIFDGWDKAFDNITSDLTVNAKWVKKTYTVTFMDGGTVLGTQVIEEGAAATAPASPTKTGYIFDGWDKAFDNITSDLTVNAKWKRAPIEAKTYTVVFKDGNTVLSNQTVEEGKAAVAPAPTKTGYTLSWDKAFGHVMANLTVNAKWTANTYKITYNVNGGSRLKKTSKKVTYDAPYGTLAVPKRAGYAFSGWYTAKTKGKKITAADSVKITKNTTLYAHWSKVANPADVKKPIVKNSAKKTMKISFKKVKGAVGYEIRYSTKSSMKSARTVTTKTTSKTIKKLTQGKTYYVQVRAYKLDSAGKKVYSKAYSTKAKVVIKK